MTDDWTPEEHTTHAQTHQLAGSICAVISLALGMLCASKLLAGEWVALLGLTVAAWLLHSANWQFGLAEEHHSAAAAKRQEQPA